MPSTQSKKTEQDAPSGQVLSKGPTAPGQARSPGSDRVQLPHERDESVGGDATAAQGTGAAGEQQHRLARQAAEDLAEGQVDTDMRATPGLDAQRRDKLVRPGKKQ